MTTYSYPEKFENIAGTVSYAFSLALMEAQFEQSLRVPLGIGVGADYAHDHLGYGVSPKDPGSIRIRAMSVEDTPALLEAEVAEALSECLLIGKGYLYRLNEDSTRQRCLARLRSMPSVTRSGFQDRHQPILFDFMKLGDWHATSATSGSATITADPTPVSITNAGNLPVKTGLVLTLEALAASGFANPQIWNQTNNTRVSTTRDSVAIGSQWKIGEPDFAVTSSAYPNLVIGKSGRHIGRAVVGNRNYANDYSLVTVTNGFIWLSPGVNQLLVSGVTNASLSYSFYGSFA